MPKVDEKKAFEKYIGATKKVVPLNRFYKKIAKKYGCRFVDTSKLKTGIDGVHLDKESHFLLAKLFFREIKKIKI